MPISESSSLTSSKSLAIRQFVGHTPPPPDRVDQRPEPRQRAVLHASFPSPPDAGSAVDTGPAQVDAGPTTPPDEGKTESTQKTANIVLDELDPAS